MVDADSDPSPERAALSNLAFVHADSEIRRMTGPDQAVPAAHSGRPLPAVASLVHTYRADLSKVRALVMRQARAAGLSEGRATDLVLAASEVAANTLRHTDSSGTLTIWHDRGEIICEIHDEGTIANPEAGQHRPAADATGGHGLWLVRQVCDLVELRSDQTGTTIRMHMKIHPAELSG
jgi:anti-sigma regulatory factor (Ser/Thr protein kinase)